MGKPRKKKSQSAVKKSAGEASELDLITCSTAPENADNSKLIGKILDKAESLISELQYELAEKFCQKAASADADNERVLTTTGILYVEMGKLEEAKQHLEKAVLLYPSSGYSKYLYLGQLLSGKEAVECYENALKIMSKVKSSASASEVTDSDIGSVYCALAELYLTDLCEADNAATECEQYLRRAIELDSKNPEVFQTYSSFLISAERRDEAVEMLKRGTDLWLPQFVALMEDETGEAQAVDCSMEFEARKACAKLAIELEQFETAEQVLDSLLAENDEEVDSWYLYGWCNYLQGPEKHAAARAYLKQALEIYRKTKHEEEDVWKHCEELLAEIGEEAADENEESMDAEEQEAMQVANELDHLDQQQSADAQVAAPAPAKRRKTKK